MNDYHSEATGIGVNSGLIVNVNKKFGIDGANMMMNEDYDHEEEFLSNFVGLSQLYRMSKTEREYRGYILDRQVSECCRFCNAVMLLLLTLLWLSVSSGLPFIYHQTDFKI